MPRIDPKTGELIEDEAAPASDFTLNPTLVREGGEAISHFLSGINPLNAVQAVLHPIDTAKGFGELAKGAGKIGLEYATGRQYQPDTATSALAEHIYENPGATVGDVAAIGFGPKVGQLAKLGAGRVLPRVASAIEESRAGNIIRAVGATKDEALKNIKALTEEGKLHSVPVGTAKQVRTKLQAELDKISPMAKKVEDQLNDEFVSTNDTALTLEKQAPGHSWETVTEDVTGQPVTKTHTLTADKALRKKLADAADDIHREGGAVLTGPEAAPGQVPAGVLVKHKRGFQDMANYEAEGATEFPKRAARAMDEAIINSPDVDPDLRQLYSGLNEEQAARLALVKPLEKRTLRSVLKQAVSRSALQHVGRTAVPVALGSVAMGAPGALAGLAASGLMESTLFNTLSAAAKMRVAEAFKAGGVPAAIEAMTIANTAAGTAQQAIPEEE